MEQLKKNIWIIIAVVVVVALAAGYFYFFKPAKNGAVNTAQKASQSVPTIATNAAEKVPEINPLDRANPFKYTNPLR